MVCGGVTTITVIAAAITASMYAGGMAPASANPPADQGASGAGHWDTRCQGEVSSVQVTVNRKTVCVPIKDLAMMASKGEDFFYDESTLAKTTIIRDTIPVLEEIYYWPWYDVKLPPFAKEVEIKNPRPDLYRPQIYPRPELAWVRHGGEPPDWIDFSTKPMITNINQGLGPDDGAFWPQYAMEFEHGMIAYRTITHPYKFTYNYTYVIPSEGGDYGNPIHQCLPEQCEGQYLEIQVSSYMRLLNKDAEFILQATDTAVYPPHHYNVYRMPLPFDNTKPMQLDLVFFLSFSPDQKPPTLSHIGMMYPRVHDTGDAMYLFLSRFNIILFDPTVGDAMIGQSWFAPTSYDKGTEINRVVQNGLVWSKGQAGPPIEVVRLPGPEPKGPIDGVGPEYYLYLAGTLSENYPLGNYAKILQESNIKQEWIDGFLNAVPYLKPTLLEMALGSLTAGPTAHLGS